MANAEWNDAGKDLRHAVSAVLAILILLGGAWTIAILWVSGSLGQTAGSAPGEPAPAASIPAMEGASQPADADVRPPTTLPHAPSPEAPCRILLLADHAYPRDYSCLPCECVWVQAR